ncbi:hypothetical protein [Kineosporia babensis]|uniref:Uncharacterized protein n=1 Tax=Kineosporia babensis TaxID=499548 RepID=A0A9X1NJU0_9ACTN|nr:hypothetical protein [Kineosporia babensis]MCD5315480.1 hypothetical protein [Kineosporia babensis]
MFVAAEDQPLELGSLTDEEIVALDPAAESGIAPLPWLSSVPAESKAAVLATALRGLAARGLYQALPAAGPPARLAGEADGRLLAVLSMRSTVPAVIIAERHRDAAVEWALLYPQHSDLWLHEVVTGNGIHTFALGRTSHWVAELARWCAPDTNTTHLRSDGYLVHLPAGAVEGPRMVVSCPVTSIITQFTVDRASNAVTESWSAVHSSTEEIYLASPDSDGVNYHGCIEGDLLRHWEELTVRTTDQRK